MYCRFCGKENKDDQKFCKYCGKNLYIQTVNHRDLNDAERDERQKYHAKEHHNNESFTSEKSKTKKSMIVTGVLSGLLMIAIVLCVVVYFKDGTKRISTADEEQQSSAEVESNEKIKEDSAVEENKEEENTHKDDIDEEEDTDEKKNMEPQAVLESFINGDINASIFDEDMYYSDMKEKYDTKEFEYRDIDNDGEEELLIYSELNFYPLIALDVIDGKIKELCVGDGTAAYLTFYDVDGITWACFSDTTHQGRQGYDFVQYKGSDIVDRFTLSAEYWDNENDQYDENSIFTYRDHAISMNEYEELLKKYTGNDIPIGSYDNDYSNAEEGYSSSTEFWGVWIFASKDEQESKQKADELSKLGYYPEIVYSCDWENLNKEPYYCVSVGCFDSESTANDFLNKVKSEGYADAYVKSTGKRK